MEMSITPPDWMVPMGTCEIAGCKNILFGKRLDNGQVVHLKDERGKPVKICATCEIRAIDERYKRDMALASENAKKDAEERARLGIGASQIKSAARKNGRGYNRF
jgi:hypothetical protein